MRIIQILILVSSFCLESYASQETIDVKTLKEAEAIGLKINNFSSLSIGDQIIESITITWDDSIHDKGKIINKNEEWYEKRLDITILDKKSKKMRSFTGYRSNNSKEKKRSLLMLDSLKIYLKMFTLFIKFLKI